MSADGQQEPSMEDILASIRKILSEDDGEAAKPEPAKAAPAPKAAEPPPPPPPPAPEPEPEPMPEPEPEPVIVAADPEPEPEPEPSIFDELPEEPGPDITAVEPEPEPEPLELSAAQQVPQEPVYQQPMYQQQEQYAPQYAQQYAPQQYLVGDPAAQAASASIAGLAQAVARERAISLGNSGITLEQLVREICTPVLKHWLDTNLPYMVERIVKQEIERIVNRSETM
jgi:cell pole-organizing protein PopZ